MEHESSRRRMTGLASEFGVARVEGEARALRMVEPRRFPGPRVAMAALADRVGCVVRVVVTRCAVARSAAKSRRRRFRTFVTAIAGGAPVRTEKSESGLLLVIEAEPKLTPIPLFVAVIARALESRSVRILVTRLAARELETDEAAAPIAPGRVAAIAVEVEMRPRSPKRACA